jgi:ABC-2 type transport system permease protein
MIYTIFKNENKRYFGTVTGYIAIAVYLVAVWLFCWVFPSSSFLGYGFAEMGTFFEITPYIFLFLIPALTMRLFAEEFKSGTYELLITKPITEIRIILGKFFSSWFLVLLALLLTLVFFYSLWQMASPIGNVDVSGVFGSYLGLLFLGGVFCAIGIFTSSITDNQIVSFILSFVISFFLYDVLGRLAGIESLSGITSNFLQDIGLNTHYEAMGRGVIDSRDVVYFGSLIIAFLFLTQLVLKNKRN